MAKDLFSNLNLNLLRTFLVIYQENNLQKASARLNVSPPALTKSLNNLREHFDDRLFVKVSSGLSPTPFAEKLYENISPLIEKLAFNINTLNGMDPSQLKGRLSVAMSPFLLHAIGKELFTRVYRQAPALELHLVNWSETSIKDIQSNKVRFGINYGEAELPKEVIRKKVASDQFKIYMRKGHPLDGKEADLQTITKYPIATLITSGWNAQPFICDKKASGLKSNIVFRSDQLSAIFEIVSDSDVLCTASQYEHLERNPLLCSTLCKTLPDSFQFDISVLFHHKDQYDPVISWFSEIVEQLLTH